MINKIVLISLLTLSLTGEELAEKHKIYKQNCIPCHEYLPYSLEKIYMLYLKTFSGKVTFKASLKAFLKKPMEETSLMPDEWIENFSVKEKTTLSDKELDEAIDSYWELYDVRNKLR
ncbi:hypothetical protein MNB_SV-13-179 [hydrothermal vent metagenome]|uniref:Cytochrome c domain-containing protein n=1 Tax=hydrothermal vent metagenome TaxID=652676 RepID=A0A1W1C0N1_9ZZZZ